MLHLYLKAVHIIGFVTWFAGILYLVRLFVYHIEALEAHKDDSIVEEYHRMQTLLYRIIATPGMVITLVCGIAMLVYTPGFLQQSWIHAKLLLITFLVIYHLYCGRIISSLLEGRAVFTSWHMRLFNELPTVLLAAIVFLAVLKNNLNALYGTLGFVIFAAVLFASAFLYKKSREKNTRS